MNKQKLLFIFLAILVIAAVVRGLWLETVPASLYWDETAILADARAISLTGSDLHGEAIFKPFYYSYGDYKMPVYIIATALTTWLVGAGELAVRLPNLIAGIGTMVITAYLGSRAFITQDYTQKIPDKDQDDISKKQWLFAVLVIMVLAITPWHFHFSRVGFEAFMGQFFLATSVAAVFMKRGDKLKFIIAGLLGALGVYSYFSVRFVWPVVFLAAVFYYGQTYLNTHFNWRRLIGQAGLGLVVFSLALLPLFLSDKYQPSNQIRYSTDSLLSIAPFAVESNIYRELAGNSFIDRGFFHRELLRLRQFGTHLAEHLNPNYLFVNGDSNLRHGTGNHGLLLLSMAPFLLFGLIQLFKRQKSLWLFLVIWWLAALVPASVPYTVPHGLRSLNGLVPLTLLTSYGIWMAWHYLRQQWSIKLTRLIMGIILLIMIFEFVAFVYYYYTAYPVLSAEEWQSGHKQVVQTVEQNQLVDPIYSVNTDDRLYLWFLAFGSYTTDDFNNWQGQLKDEILLEPVRFSQQPDFAEVPANTSIIAPAGNQQTLETAVVEAGRTVSRVIPVFDLVGNKTHLILVLE